MPHSGSDDPKLPEHVQVLPVDKRRQWIAVFERVLDDTGDEGQAMHQANAAVKQTPTTRVKALTDEGRVGGYLVLWGTAQRRDLQNEYFTPDTDLGLDWYPRRPVLYHHGLDAKMGPVMIGQIETLGPDGTGLWVEGQLDLRERWTQAVWKLARQGALGWSSGSVPHLVQVERDGHIRRWPIVEGSLTPTPAEPRQPDIIPAKHMCEADLVIQAYKSAGLPVPDLLQQDSAVEGEPGAEPAGKSAEPGASSRPVYRPFRTTIPTHMEDPTMGDEPQVMTMDGVLALMDQREAQKKAEAEQADLKAKAQKAAELEQENATLRAKVGQLESTPARRLPGRTTDPDLPGQDGDSGSLRAASIKVMSQYDDLTPEELAFGVEVMRNLAAVKNDPSLRPSERYANALGAKAWEAGYRPVKRDGTAYKADELGHSTLTGYGDEWVPDMWSSELWRKARLENQILNLFRIIEMPSQPFELPIQGTDPTVYYVPETTNEAQLTLDSANNPTPDSQVGTGKVQLNAKKLSVRVGFSSELVEDSLVPVLPMYTEQTLRAMMDSIDNVLLNGDTVTTINTNINLNDGTPTGTSKYLAFDGLRKLPLITNTANAQDASGVPTLALMRTARFLMAPRYSVRPDKLAWLVDASTYAALLGLDEVKTIDKFGPKATVLTGEVAKVDGIPVIVSAEAPLTMADGKVDSTGNTKGQAVCVYRPGWVVGFRRRVSASMTLIPYYDAYQLVATARIAFINFDTDVSSCLYDITV